MGCRFRARAVAFRCFTVLREFLCRRLMLTPRRAASLCTLQTQRRAVGVSDNFDLGTVRQLLHFMSSAKDLIACLWSQVQLCHMNNVSESALFHYVISKSSGRPVGTPGSYLVGLCFKSRPTDRPSWMCRCCSQFYRKILGRYFEFRYDRFLPHPFHYIIH
jgi:hypothetical protein